MKNNAILNKLPRKILVIKPSSLGDIVQSLPFLDAVSRKFPLAKINWIVAKGFEGILEDHPLVEKLWVIRKDDWKKIKKLPSSAAEMRSLFKDLKKEKFDCVVDLQGLFRSGLMAKATGAPIRLGFREAREGSRLFYTHAIACGMETHAVDKYLKLAASLGCDISQVRFPLPPSGSSMDYKAFYGDYAVMVPGARWPSKIWPSHRFGELAAMLPVKTLVIGSRSDQHLAEKTVSASKGKAISLAGKTSLKELIEIIRNARFVVSNDTGPMHIAAACGVHVFAVFGSTNPARTGPYGSNSTIIRKPVPCSPCYRKTCKTTECLTMIGTGDVLDYIYRSGLI